MIASRHLAATALFLTTLPLAVAAQSPVALIADTLPDAPSFRLAALQNTLPQQAAPQASTPETEEERIEEHREQMREEGEEEVQEEEHQRILDNIVPGLNIVLNGQAVPLTPHEKFQLVGHSLYDPYYIGFAAASAGVSELRGTHLGYHWGPKGYFKRFGAAYVDFADGALWGNAILPVVLHQDPRYFRQGHGSILSRMGHAALYSFICRGDNGRNQVNYSNLAGNFISSAISNAYYPADDRTVGTTLKNGAATTAYGIIGAQVLEFGPAWQKLLPFRKRP